MIKTEVLLRTPVPAGLSEELERRILFISPDIASFELVTDDGVIGAVRLFSTVAPDSDGLSAKLNSLVESDLAPVPAVPAKVVWESAHRASFHDAWSALSKTGAVSARGEGQVVVGGPVITLLEGLDRRIRRIATETFGAVEYRYPTLLSARVLDTACYPATFPQFLMFVTRLHEDLDTYREFQASYKERGQLDASFLEYCRNLDYCLPPAMCYHAFDHHRDRVLPRGEMQVVTLQGRSFRHESRYATTLERLWDFTMREIVFLGERGDVLDARDKFMQLLFGLTDEWGLDGYCEPANDPFFAGGDPASRAWSQRLLELKYELRLRLAAGRDVAVGSFNFHDDFFGKAFNIRHADASAVVSGCTAFGLERFVYALLCQHGTDPDRWPAAVRELAEG
ncbi:hypothetical protein AB0M36_07800 [Actinoplanes sp. NPDC051346]|uniref:hypothetical protein n=1 Tax=Actinoplanes sp. NPDC051346 TaxID=3155048 RepID=UPI003434FF08